MNIFVIFKQFNNKKIKYGIYVKLYKININYVIIQIIFFMHSSDFHFKLLTFKTLFCLYVV